MRPKMTAESAIIAGLLPIMRATGSGADVMKKIEVPMIGGVVTSALLELMVYPVIYCLWMGRQLKKARVKKGSRFEKPCQHYRIIARTVGVCEDLTLSQRLRNIAVDSATMIRRIPCRRHGGSFSLHISGTSEQTLIRFHMLGIYIA